MHIKIKKWKKWRKCTVWNSIFCFQNWRSFGPSLNVYPWTAFFGDWAHFPAFWPADVDISNWNILLGISLEIDKKWESGYNGFTSGETTTFRFALLHICYIFPTKYDFHQFNDFRGFLAPSQVPFPHLHLADVHKMRHSGLREKYEADL